MTAFLATPNVQTALVASTLVASLSAIVGYFVVVRGVSFAGHAMTDIGLTGGAGALMLGLDPIIGLLAFALGAAATVAGLGTRARERDLATGLLLAVALALGALFLHFAARTGSARSALLFGSIFETDPGTLRGVAVLAATCAVALGIMFRPLLFASVAPESAFVRGVPVRSLGYAFLALLAIAVAETARIVGVFISTALLVGPAATSIALVRSPVRGIVTAVAVAMGTSWLSILCAYESFTWGGDGRSWPVSFFVAAFALLTYLGARQIGRIRG